MRTFDREAGRADLARQGCEPNLISAPEPGEPVRLDALEPRLLMAVDLAAVLAAMDFENFTDRNPFPADTATYDGPEEMIQARDADLLGDLFAFPTGYDSDYLVWSTGQASDVGNTIDDGIKGPGSYFGDSSDTPDKSSIAVDGIIIPYLTPELNLRDPVLTIEQIREQSRPVRLMFDVVFLSEEYPDFVERGYDDFFKVDFTWYFTDGTFETEQITVDENGQEYGVERLLTGDYPILSTDGLSINGRVQTMTFSYTIPIDVSYFDLDLSMQDVQDGFLDTAVILDNFRFEAEKQQVLVNFDGGSVGDFFGEGTDTTLPAFSAADLGGADGQSRAAKDAVLAQLRQLFAGMDIFFTDDINQVYGEYMTVHVGGSNNAAVAIDAAVNPILANQLGDSTTFRQMYQATHPQLTGKNWTLYGASELQNGQIDLNNEVRDDQAVVFSQHFITGKNLQTNIDRLTNAIAHQIGNNLGVRDTDPTDRLGDSDVMSTKPLKTNAHFYGIATQLNEKGYYDGVKAVNSRHQLMETLGTPAAARWGGAIEIRGFTDPKPVPLATFTPIKETSNTDDYRYYQLTLPAGLTLYNVKIGIVRGDRVLARMDEGATVYTFEQIDGQVLIALPAQYQDAKLYLYASSTEDGPVDVFSGNPGSDGVLSTADTLVSLFRSAETPVFTFNLRSGTPDSSTALGVAFLEESGVNVDGQLFQKTGLFTDSDGDLYSVTLRGPGNVTYVKNSDPGNHGPILSLVLEDTTLNSHLVINLVKRHKNGNGLITLGGITGSVMGSVTAANVALRGQADFTRVESVTLFRLDSAGVFNVTGTSPVALKVLYLNDNATVDVKGALSLTTAQADRADIKAAAFDRIIVNHRLSRGATGDLNADLTADAQGLGVTDKSLDLVQVTGSVRDANWSFQGDIKRILVNGVAINLNLTATTSSIVSASFRKMQNVNLNVDRRIGTLTTFQSNGGSVTTGTLGQLITKRRVKDAFLTGDFNTPLDLTGDFADRNVLALGQANVAGSVNDVAWNIADSADRITVANAGNWDLNLDGNLNALTVHLADDVDVQSTGAITSIVSSQWRGGSIDAGTLGAVRVQRFLTDADLTADHAIGSVIVGGLNHVNILAGADDAFLFAAVTPNSDPNALFNQQSLIGRVIVKGVKGARYATGDFIVAAWSIGSLHYVDLNPDNAGSPFGIAAVNLGAVKSVDDKFTFPGSLEIPQGGIDTPIAGDAKIVVI
jgi:hypothetical protein